MENNIGLSTMYHENGYRSYSKAILEQEGKSPSEVMADTAIDCFKSVADRRSVNDHSNLFFTVADFGTADGGTIIPVMNSIIDVMEQRFEKMAELTIILEDQPLNDFNLLHKIINGLYDKLHVKLKSSENVNVLVSGRSMYEKCLRSSCLDLATCSIAIHWLSKKPCNFTNGMDIFTATEQERKMFQEQAADDWLSFLENRGKELKEGGYLIVLCLVEDVNTPLIVKGGRLVYSAVLRKLLERGFISMEEFVNITPPEYHRNEKELRQPFQGKNPRVANMEIVSLTYRKTIYIKGIEESESKNMENVKQYAKNVVGVTKPWWYYTVLGGLSVARPESERRQIAEEYFNILYEHVLNMPTHPDSGIHFAEIVIRKI